MRLLLCMTLAAVLCAPAAHAEPFDKMVPDSTVFYASIENLNRSKERFKASALHGLWADAAVQAFLAKPLKKWDAEMTKMKAEAGFTVQDLMEIIHGQVAVVIPGIELEEDGDVKDPEPVVLIDVGRNTEKLMALIARVEKGPMAQKNLRRVEAEFRGVKVIHYVDPDAEEGKSKNDGPRAWYLDGSTFALAGKPAHLHAILARKGDAEAPSLATSETYRKVRARMGESPDMVAYVGMKAVHKVLAEKRGEDVAIARAVIGLDAIQGMGMHVKLGRAVLTMNMFVAMGEKQGLMKIFDAKNSPLKPPKWVPADAADVTTMSLDMAALLAEARKVEARLGANGTIDQAIESMKGVGIDLEKDIIGALGKEITMFSKVGGGNAAAPGALGLPPTGIAFALKDKARFSGAIDKLLAMIAQFRMPGQDENYMDRKIRKVSIFGQLEIALCVLDDQFIVSTQADLIKDVVRIYGKDQKGLVDGEEFDAAMKTIPQGRMLVGFQRFAKALREGILMSLIQSEAAGDVDMNLFPKAEAFEKYLGSAASAMVSEEGGLFYTYVLGLKAQSAETRDGG